MRCLRIHPIKEGKLVCSDCMTRTVRKQATSRKQPSTCLCYKCHADKQGPFAFEHPPVREKLRYLSEPHGTVTNNLLRQPLQSFAAVPPGHYAQHPPGNINLRVDTDSTLRQPFIQIALSVTRRSTVRSDLPARRCFLYR